MAQINIILETLRMAEDHDNIANLADVLKYARLEAREVARLSDGEHIIRKVVVYRDGIQIGELSFLPF